MKKNNTILILHLISLFVFIIVYSCNNVICTKNLIEIKNKNFKIKI